ncbi:unnamed protein product [Tilletia controversa]|nr:unnamed protein product [Tilletia controversa]CAD6932099.1 unnamed protein product [Tilletia controversa]CAD6967907.1 unnamed protein product [Tilletia controversa]CAD6972307.1 unnamed protein product [Tilletia controversa]
MDNVQPFPGTAQSGERFVDRTSTIPTFFSDRDGPGTAAEAAQAAALALIAGRSLYRARDFQRMTEREVAELEQLLGSKRSEASEAVQSVERHNASYLESVKKALLAVHLMATEAGLDPGSVISKSPPGSAAADTWPTSVREEVQSSATLIPTPTHHVPSILPAPDTQQPYAERSTPPSPKASVASLAGSTLSPYSPSSEDDSSRASLLSFNSTGRSRVSSVASSALALPSRKSSLKGGSSMTGKPRPLSDLFTAQPAVDESGAVATLSSPYHREEPSSQRRSRASSHNPTPTASALFDSPTSPVETNAPLHKDWPRASAFLVDSGDYSDSPSHAPRSSSSGSRRGSVSSQATTSLTAHLHTLKTIPSIQIPEGAVMGETLDSPSARREDLPPLIPPKGQRVSQFPSISSMASEMTLSATQPQAGAATARQRAYSSQDAALSPALTRVRPRKANQASARRVSGLEVEVVKSILAIAPPVLQPSPRSSVRFEKPVVSWSTSSARDTVDSTPPIMLSDASASDSQGRASKARVRTNSNVQERTETTNADEEGQYLEGEEGAEPRQKRFGLSIKSIASADRDAQSHMRSLLTIAAPSKSSRGRPVASARVMVNGKSGTVVRPSRKDTDDGTCDVRLDDEGSSGKGGHVLCSIRARSVDILAPDTAGGQACVVLEGPRRGLVGVLKNLATAPDSKMKDPLCWVWDPKSSQLFCVPFLHLARA